MKKKLNISYQEIISLENLLQAWREFLRGKRSKKDVQEFSWQLMDNIISLHHDLFKHTYKHGGYQAFKINDPKPRNIHKAGVRDRLLHHAVYRKLYPFFDKIFIADLFSCRLNKGTHKAINQFRKFASIVSKNHTKTCWVLKCDIRKFFTNINQEILLRTLRDHIANDNVVKLLENIIRSFSSEPILPHPAPLLVKEREIGLPLGNLTSQLFVNIYMNKFDQFIKYELREKYYIRYADDFVIFSESKEKLEDIIKPIRNFLWQELRLELHPKKIFIKTVNSGVDFLGWVNFCDHRVLRTTTKRRMSRRINERPSLKTINSYLGLLKHGNTIKLRKKIIKMI